MQKYEVYILMLKPDMSIIALNLFIFKEFEYKQQVEKKFSVE